MEITRKSMLTGIVHTLDLSVTQEQLNLRQDGALIQDVMPNLSAEEREFIITGITPKEWDDMTRYEKE